jgi:anti-sigma regulatory factor (Ser/Thr protein kinase)
MRTQVLVRDTAPVDARRAVALQCRSAATGPTCTESAVVATSEVVTNAVRYSAGEIRLGVDADAARVRVEVSDDEPVQPCSRAAGAESEGGRGMLIVDAVASDWGAFATPRGKIVWFEVAAQP